MASRHLARLPSLQHLDLSGTAITDVGLQALRHLPNLRTLSLAWTRIDELEHVNLSVIPQQGESWRSSWRRWIRGVEPIEQIWGRRCHNLRTRGFVALADMPALRGLSVSCLSVDHAGIAVLPAFPALRELMPIDVPDAGYRHVGRCERLQSLVLMYCRETTDAATEHITGLRMLTYYFNSYTTITDRTPELLSTIDSLERVTFDACHGLTNAGVASLARLPQLRELRVSGNRITPDVGRPFPARVAIFQG